jgi:hypothetical protein
MRRVIFRGSQCGDESMQSCGASYCGGGFNVAICRAEVGIASSEHVPDGGAAANGCTVHLFQRICCFVVIRRAFPRHRREWHRTAKSCATAFCLGCRFRNSAWVSLGSGLPLGLRILVVGLRPRSMGTDQAFNWQICAAWSFQAFPVTPCTVTSGKHLASWPRLHGRDRGSAGRKIFSD